MFNDQFAVYKGAVSAKDIDTKKDNPIPWKNKQIACNDDAFY